MGILSRMKAAFCNAFGRGVFVGLGAGSLIAFGLTYDEFDSENLLSLTRLGDGPHITPQGFYGNGYDSRYVLSTIPSWLSDAGEPLTVHASVTPLQGPRNSVRDVLVSVANATAPKLQLAIVPDAKDASQFQVAARSYDGTTKEIKMARRDWVFQGRYPLLRYMGHKARPQGIAFYDDNTLLVTAHYNFQYSWCHRIDIATGAVTGSFIFETADASMVAPKIGAISKRQSDGSWWFTDNDTKLLLDIDLDASFSSGKMVVNNTFDASAVFSTAAIMWTNVAGSEYLLISEYRDSATAYIYVINGSDVGSNSVFVLANRYKRFLSPQKSQGMAMRDGLMYVSSNNPATTSAFTGVLYTTDIETMIQAAADGAAIAIIQQFSAPGAYPEDLAVHPVTGDLWTQTEGMTDFESHDGFLSIWSGRVDGSPAENHYTLQYQSGLLTAKVNNKVFDTLAITPTISSNSVAIGGPATAVAGQQNGFAIAAVRDLLIKNGLVTLAEYEQAISGGYEDSELTTYVVPLINPGAEDGVVGWTNEVGGIDTRSAEPPPHTGNFYFNGGPHAQTIARQRHNLLDVTGMSGSEIDSAVMWARVGWWQASWNNAAGTSTDRDTAGVGIRYLNAAQGNIETIYPGQIRMDPRLTWIERGTSVVVPSGARFIDALYRANRLDGTNNDGRIDDISLVVYKQ